MTKELKIYESSEKALNRLLAMHMPSGLNPREQDLFRAGFITSRLVNRALMDNSRAAVPALAKECADLGIISADMLQKISVDLVRAGLDLHSQPEIYLSTCMAFMRVINTGVIE